MSSVASCAFSAPPGPCQFCARHSGTARRPWSLRFLSAAPRSMAVNMFGACRTTPCSRRAAPQDHPAATAAAAAAAPPLLVPYEPHHWQIGPRGHPIPAWIQAAFELVPVATDKAQCRRHRSRRPRAAGCNVPALPFAQGRPPGVLGTRSSAYYLLCFHVDHATCMLLLPHGWEAQAGSSPITRWVYGI